MLQSIDALELAWRGVHVDRYDKITHPTQAGSFNEGKIHLCGPLVSREPIYITAPYFAG